MTHTRGDVILARVPHLAGTRGKKRPAVVIQSDTMVHNLNDCLKAALGLP